MNVRAGSQLIAIGYDSVDIARQVSQRLSPWLIDDDREVDPVFGIREAKVGFLRRTVAVLHYGVPVRARFGDVDRALDIVAQYLREIEHLDELARERPGEVALNARAFVRNGQLALVNVPLNTDVDDRRLGKLGIEEVHTYRPVIDPVERTVTIDGRSWPLSVVVLLGRGELDLDEARRQAWGLATPSEMAWANLIDALGDRVVASSLDLPDALDRAVR